MDLHAYLDIIRRRGWIILVTVRYWQPGWPSAPPRCKPRSTGRPCASAVPARPDWGLGNSAKDLLRNFVNNLNTHDMANRVIANAKLDMNSYDLLAKITVSAEPENFIIHVDAKDQDPEIAKKIATTMSGEFVDDRVAYYNTRTRPTASRSSWWTA